MALDNKFHPKELNKKSNIRPGRTKERKIKHIFKIGSDKNQNEYRYFIDNGRIWVPMSRKKKNNLTTHKVPAGKHLPIDKGSFMHLNSLHW